MKIFSPHIPVALLFVAATHLFGSPATGPLRVNSELGTEEDFDEMADKLRHYGMGLLLDTVPNHMAASYENPWWTDVLENGPSSAFAGYFDIDWHPPTAKASWLQDNRVLLPVLGDLYGHALENGQFALKIELIGLVKLRQLTTNDGRPAMIPEYSSPPRTQVLNLVPYGVDTHDISATMIVLEVPSTMFWSRIPFWPGKAVSLPRTVR